MKLDFNVKIDFKAFVFILSVILFVVFVGMAFYFKDWVENELGAQLFAALAGAAIVAIITQVLLKSQSEAENEKEQNKAKFSEKLTSYNHFLNTLNQIVKKGHLSAEDEADVQFQLLNVNLHTSSENTLILCRNLNDIIRKLKVEQPLEYDMWNELYSIENVFHNELYQVSRPIDDLLTQELNSLRAPETYRNADRTLAFVQDSLSLCPDLIVTKRIGYRHLKITIPRLEEYRKEIGAKHVILIISVNSSDMKGTIYLSTDGDINSLQKIIDSPEYLRYGKGRDELSENKKLIFVGTERMDNVVELIHLKSDSDNLEYLKMTYLSMDLLCALWWDKEKEIKRRDFEQKDNLSSVQIFRYPEDIRNNE